MGDKTRVKAWTGICNILLEVNMPQDLDTLLVARFLYAKGKPILSDAEYDELAAKVKEAGVVLDPIYEKDEIPYEAFRRLVNYDKAKVDAYLETIQITEPVETAQEATNFFISQDNAPDFDLLAESDSLSISAVTNFNAAYCWFEDNVDTELVISTKIDGINTRRGYKYRNNKLTYNAALTRGRKSDPLDITFNLGKISPRDIDTDIAHDLVVYSETIVPFQAIAYINEKYDADYTIPRNLAMAMMRVDRFEQPDFDYLKTFVFRIDWGETLSQGLEKAKAMGFDVVPYVTYTYHHMSFEEFVPVMEKIIAELKSQTDAMSIITDGMVAEVNDRSLAGQAGISNNYSSANIALKIGLWQPGVYESEVVALDLSQHSEQCSCVAVVKPVTAKGGQQISRVNCFNPSVLFANDIRPGKRIRFEYKNETTVNLITENWRNLQ